MTDKPRLTKRDIQRIETRERLFQVAIDEFLRVGVDKAQIEVIVKKADVSVGTFYRNFPNKNDVIIELMQRYMADIGTTILEKINQSYDSLEDRLLAVIDPIFEFLDKERENPLIREVYAAILRQPPHNVDWAEHPFLQPIIESFEQYHSIEEVAPEFDAVRLTRMFFTAVFGFITIMNPIRSETEARAFVKIFLQGIKSPTL